MDANVEKKEVTPAQAKAQSRKRILVRVLIALGVILVLLAVTIIILVFAVGGKLAQSAINGSSITFTSAAITNASDATFTLSSNGSITNSGVFGATISAPDPIKVYWTNRDGGDLLLGSIPQSPITVAGLNKGGSFSMSNTFAIADKSAMTQFATYLNTNAKFSWRLVGTVTVAALGRNYGGLSFDKTIDMLGFNSFPNGTITKLAALPGPNNTFIASSTAVIRNPSNITLELGTVTFNTSLAGTPISSLTSTSDSVVLVPGDNIVPLMGGIDGKAFSLVGKLLVNGTTVEVTGAGLVSKNNGVVSWLNGAFVGFKTTAITALSP